MGKLIEQHCQIILASTSAIRKQILSETDLEFSALAPDYDEEAAKDQLIDLSIKQKAIELSCGKALSISKKHPQSYVIGSDQICDLNDAIISKSKNIAEAVLQLKRLTGKNHNQNNAVVIAYQGKIVFENFSQAHLQMRDLSESQISSYVNADQAWGSAGSYKYESLGKHLFTKVSGDYHAILGFHIQPVLEFFHKNKLITIKN